MYTSQRTGCQLGVALPVFGDVTAAVSELELLQFLQSHIPGGRRPHQLTFPKHRSKVVAVQIAAKHKRTLVLAPRLGDWIGHQTEVDREHIKGALVAFEQRRRHLTGDARVDRGGAVGLFWVPSGGSYRLVLLGETINLCANRLGKPLQQLIWIFTVVAECCCRQPLGCCFRRE